MALFGHDELVKSGWGVKRGHVRTSWKKRFFTLTKSAIFAYYADESARAGDKSKGSVRLLGSGVEILGPRELRSDVKWPKAAPENARLQIVVPNRIYSLYFDTGTECEAWLLHLRQVTGRLKLATNAGSNTSSSTQAQIEDDALQHELHQTLQTLVAQPGNNTCADCHRSSLYSSHMPTAFITSQSFGFSSSRSHPPRIDSLPEPTWASWNIGVFICLHCAGAHRSLGSHISKVKSIALDTWSRQQVGDIKKKGNNAVNAVYEAKLEASYARPMELDAGLSDFIRRKYVDQQWAATAEAGEQLHPNSTSPSSRDDQTKNANPFANDAGNASDSDFDPRANESDARVLATMQSEAAALHAANDPMAQHDWS
ncbi:uncharacterized protein MONBRDRAFT_22929 [Monosiga brevicollis MX1]|uniref:Arf-GAP domain-containing protein n=1 Tax=Monosiga brevicollis TaxID=81824 RepID=A9USH5_MONBE|nr:uncharacterized protein MONBRDRAFT_22929 [Monosiga brevicollis MX1]EDQ92101.1 predicted protein [Monosiga brevicollis MX1]|eukprot:XP_001743387.1 hypothetical protein [Monosiga brevicollis MX1]